MGGKFVHAESDSKPAGPTGPAPIVAAELSDV